MSLRSDLPPQPQDLPQQLHSRKRWKLARWLIVMIVVAVPLLGWLVWLGWDRPDPQHRLEVLLPSPAKFDPIGTDETHESTVLGLIHDRPVHVDTDSGVLVPGLAESWSSSSDAKTWTFRLREAATPNGIVLTAADVEFSYRLYMNEHFQSSARANLLANGQPIKCRVVDDHTVEFSAPSPIPHFPWALQGVTIFPQAVFGPLSASGETWRAALGATAKPEHLSGFGPYHVAKRSRSQIDLVRNPNFWGRDADGNRLPRMDAIRLTLVDDLAGRKVRFKNDDRFLFDQPDALELRDYEGDARFKVVDLGVDGSTFFMWLNQGKGSKLSAAKQALFRDERFRRALARVINRDEIIKQVFQGRAVPLYGPVSEAYPWAAPTADLKELTPSYDPAKAREELAALGVSDTDGDGFFDFAGEGGARERLTLQILTTDPDRKRAVDLIVAQLRALGVDASGDIEEKKVVVGRIMGTIPSVAYDYTSLTMFLEGSAHPAQTANMYRHDGRMHFMDPPPYKTGLYTQDPPLPWQQNVARLYGVFATSPDPAVQVQAFNELQNAWVRAQPVFYICTRKAFLVVRNDQWELTGHAKTGNTTNPVLDRPFVERVQVLGRTAK